MHMIMMKKQTVHGSGEEMSEYVQGVKTVRGSDSVRVDGKGRESGDGSVSSVALDDDSLEDVSVDESGSEMENTEVKEEKEVYDSSEKGNDGKEDEPKGFSGRLGFFLTVLGCAVGTGNIWRFSRITALYAGDKGGGIFILVWMSYLFLWAIPLIICEYALGRKTRKGVVSTYTIILGRKFRPLGMFIVGVTTLISCYYAVISAWCVFYAGRYIFFPLPGTVSQAEADFDDFTSSIYAPVFCHIIVLTLVFISVYWGVESIERTNKLLVPALLTILFVCLVRSLTLTGAMKGVSFLFSPDWSILKNPKTYIEALCQISFDTSSGTGEFITYAVYMTSPTQSVVRAGIFTPLLNNVVSLTSATTTFATTFALLGGRSNSEILSILRHSGPAGSGMTFVWYPLLFNKMDFGGRVLCILFFLGLSFASLSSLLATFEVGIRTLVDGQVERKKACVYIVLITFIGGIGSAVSTSFLANQDFVWGGCLLFCGGCEVFLVLKYGIRRFRENIVNLTGTVRADMTLRRWFDAIMKFLIPPEIFILLIWWLIDSISGEENWYDPVGAMSIMTFMVQSALLMVTVATIQWTLHKRHLRKNRPTENIDGATAAKQYDMI